MKKTILLSFDFPPIAGGISTYAQELSQALEHDKPGSVEVIVPFQANGQRLSAFRSVFFFFRQLREKNVRESAVFCTNWYPCGLAAWAYSILAGKKFSYFLAAHGAELLEKKSAIAPVKRFLKKKVLGRARGIFPVSQFTAKKVAALLPRSARAAVNIIPNGVNLARFSSAAAAHPSERPVIFTLCRLERHKGVDTALQAIALLKKRGIECEYRIAGGGSEFVRLKILAQNLGIEHQVKFLGRVADSELPSLYQNCDLFLLLSRELDSAVEGFGLVYLEAAACGKTSVATRSGGIDDAILHQQTGWLVRPDSPESAADALQLLLKDSALRQRLATAAHQRAHLEMGWCKVAKRIRGAMEAGHG